MLPWLLLKYARQIMTDPVYKPIIAITMGDPCGVGPEVIVKALGSPAVRECCTPFVIGDSAAMERALAVCGSPLSLRMITVPDQAHTVQDNEIAILALSRLENADLIYGQPTSASGDVAYRYICSAAHFCLDGQAAAMVTAPISKEALNRAGHHYPGHTELLAELCGTDQYVMMLAGDLLRVSLVTIHTALSEVADQITFEQVLNTIRITEAGVRQITGIERPRLAVAALNPHCGEGGMFGNQDQQIVEPAVAAAREAGIDAIGPLSADTLFYFAQQGQYDGVVTMYHDQGLIPLKMLHFDDAVNITLGLPIIRTSVDHGTAYGLAGTGTASESSMLAAIRMAASMRRK
jgi:4-hydroxythreonine-4-phosphate dehydrogenase